MRQVSFCDLESRQALREVVHLFWLEKNQLGRKGKVEMAPREGAAVVEVADAVVVSVVLPGFLGGP